MPQISGGFYIRRHIEQMPKNQLALLGQSRLRIANINCPDPGLVQISTGFGQMQRRAVLVIYKRFHIV